MASPPGPAGSPWLFALSTKRRGKRNFFPAESYGYVLRWQGVYSARAVTQLPGRRTPAVFGPAV